jgi:23S rRNA (cytosine1962-C5)-methyltransferase
VHAESDGLPGLVIDRFDDVIVLQINTAGMQSSYPMIKEAIIKLLNPRAIILRNDTPVRAMEGLDQAVLLDHGQLPQPKIEITENGARFLVDVMDGQKTGWFFDQRDNRAHVASLSAGRSMVDVFSHTGGFGIAAAVAGATSVSFIDSSHAAIEGAMKNAELNKVYQRCNGIEGKAFEVMETMARGQQKFDVVSVDPPAFIKTRKDMGSGLKGYEKLARLSAPVVARGGILFFASCSHHASLDDLKEAVIIGIGKSKRPFQIIRTGFAAPDHPVHPHLPETGYLKSLTFRFMD